MSSEIPHRGMTRHELEKIYKNRIDDIMDWAFPRKRSTEGQMADLSGAIHATVVGLCIWHTRPHWEKAVKSLEELLTQVKAYEPRLDFETKPSEDIPSN